MLITFVFGYCLTASGFRFSASGVWFPVSGFRLLVFCVWFPVFSFPLLAFGVQISAFVSRFWFGFSAVSCSRGATAAC